MIQPMSIGQQSIQIAEDFIQNSYKLTARSDNFNKISEKEYLLNQQHISTQQAIKSIKNIVHDDSLTYQERVQMVKQGLAKPAKAEIILVNSEYIKSSDVQRHITNNGQVNPERSVIKEQSNLLGYQKQNMRKINVQKKQRDEQVIDSMFNDSIFNKIEPINNLTNFDGFKNYQLKKLQQPKTQHDNMKEQMQKLKEQNSMLKKQLNSIKKMILSLGNLSKNSSGTNKNISQSLKIRKILTQSILESKFIEETDKQSQVPKEKTEYIKENLSSHEQKYKILFDQLANQKKMKDQLQETLKKRINQFQCQISAMKKRIINPCGKNIVDILNYLNKSFSNIHENSTKVKCADMIITHVSSYTRK